MTAHWWPVMLLTPLVGILAVWRWPVRAQGWLWLCCLPVLAAAVWPPAEISMSLWPGARWGLDEMRRGFLAFTAVAWLAATVYAGSDNPGTRDGRSFWLAWMLTFTGNILLIISLDGGGFYFGYSLMSLSAYLLIVHGWASPQRKGGRLYLQLAIISEVLIFAGLMLRLGESTFANEISQWPRAITAPATAALLLAGFGIKLGVWPLHLWMPSAYFAARPAVCCVLSGAMMKTALLGLWTFQPAESPLLTGWSPWLLAIAVVSAFYGVAVGLAQKDPRRVLAYSSMSQAGYLLAIVALAWGQPEQRSQWALLLLIFAVHHGFAKGALFLGAGLAASRRLSPAHWLIMAIPALALAGLPLTTGAVAKTLLEEGIKETAYKPLAALLLVGSAASALLVLRALWRMYLSQPDKYKAFHPDGKTLAWAILSLMPAALPWLWPALADPLRLSLTIDKILPALGPVVGAVILAGLGFRLHLALPRISFRRQPQMILSLRLKTLIDNASMPSLNLSPDSGMWRHRERRWNNFWTRRNTVAFTALNLSLLFIVGWLWWS